MADELDEEGFLRLVLAKGQIVHPGALMVMYAMGPRQFHQDHVVCVACGPEGAGQCIAVLLAKEACKYADRAGHPEWVDGEWFPGIPEAE